MFFKKQKPAEQPRGRQRPVVQTSQQSTVFSYHANRVGSADPRGRQMPQAEQKPPRPPRRPLPKLKNVALAIAVLVLFFMAMGVSDKPKLVVLGDTNSVFLQDMTQYQQTAQQLFQKSLLNSNKLTINTAPIVQGLVSRYPEIRTATVALPVFGSQPTVYLQPALPQLILATQRNGQFVLDSSGRALVAVDKRMVLPTGSKALPAVTDESGIEVKVGDIALPKKSVAFVMQVAGQLKAKQLAVSGWRMPAQASELDISLSGVPYYVRFNLQGSAREEAGSFLATKNYLDGKNIKPAEYVDVRVSGRAYYK